MATIQNFQNIDIRVGRVISVKDFPEAKKPAYKLTIDLGGEIGTKKSSVQRTLGVPDGRGNCYLVVPDRAAPVGGRR